MPACSIAATKGARAAIEAGPGPQLDEVATFVANLVAGIVAGGLIVGAVALARTAWQRARSGA